MTRLASVSVNKPKILAISSPGGHWIQLTYLCNGLKNHYRIIYAVPDKLFKAQRIRKNYSIMDFSTDDKWRLVPCCFQITRILLKERPQAILSTGAAPGVVAIWIGKILGIRVVF